MVDLSIAMLVLQRVPNECSPQSKLEPEQGGKPVLGIMNAMLCAAWM
jgi:hypothetical protein